jgi:hypothetical membrane protein
MRPLDGHIRHSFFIGFSGAAGIAAFLVGVFGTIVLGFFKPGYDPLRSTISELGERGGANAAIASIGFIFIGLSLAVFAIGLYLRSKPSKPAFIGSILIAANGLSDYVGSGLFPCDAAGGYVSFSGQVHFIVSVIGMVVMIFPAFFYWRAFKKAGRRIETAATAIAAITVVIAAVVFNIAFFSEAAWLGLAQRFICFAYLAWILVLSSRLVRKG